MPAGLHHLIIFGPQGSGKGTQAGILTKELALVSLGLGEMFRELAEEMSETGRHIKTTIDAGKLVPDHITNELVERKLGAVPPTVGFILDGYPRNRNQADALHQTLHRLNRFVPQPTLIYLTLPEEEIMNRLEKRRASEGRADDAPETIKNRLEIYSAETEPVLENIAQWARVIRIDGDQAVSAVTSDILAAL